MKIAGTVEKRSALGRIGGNPILKFTVRGAREHNVVAFGRAAERLDRAIRRGDRVEVLGSFSERYGNVRARRTMITVAED